MADESPNSPLEHIAQFIIGMLGGFLGTCLLSVILLGTFAARMNDAASGSNWPFIVVALLLVSGGAGVAIYYFRAARRKSAPRNYFALGVVAGICLALLLQGACFAIFAS